MSLAATDCFCHCLGRFQECSCPRITTCEKCRRHCLDSSTGSPQKKKRKSLGLKDKENSDPRFSFLSKEDELDLQKAFVPSNTQRSTDWAVKVFFDWKKARRDAGELRNSMNFLVQCNSETSMLACVYAHLSLYSSFA